MEKSKKINPAPLNLNRLEKPSKRLQPILKILFKEGQNRNPRNNNCRVDGAKPSETNSLPNAWSIMYSTEAWRK